MDIGSLLGGGGGGSKEFGSSTATASTGNSGGSGENEWLPVVALLGFGALLVLLLRGGK